MRAQLGAVAAMALAGVLMTGCGSGSTGANAASSSPTSSAASGSASPTPTSPSPASPTTAPASATGTAAEQTFHGKVAGHGLTCIGFTTDDGKRYDLTGKAIPARVRKVAHSGFRDGGGKPLEAKLTVIGHVEPHAMSTCGYTVLMASKVTVTSVGPMSVPDA